MSKPTKILIKEFGLHNLLRERVFVTWEDQSGTSRVLGCRSDCNGQNLEFFIAAYYDMEGHIHIHFSLQVSIIVRGNKQKIELLLVVPPDADLADASRSQIISNIDKLSHYHASAIHDAGISNSTHVICIPFNLVAEGFVVMKKKQSTATMKAANQPSRELIRSFQSLSITKTFTGYIKPNDYALVGLEDLRNRLTNTGTPGPRKTITREMYIRQALELVEWSRFDAISPPPAYIETPRLFPEIQVPRSPPMVFEQKTPLIHSVEAAIAETPTRTPTSSNHTSVHGIFSSNCEELLDNEVNLDDIEEDTRSMEMEMNFNVDSDEEQLAILKSRELSQEFNYDLEVLQILDSKLLNWIQTAIRINSSIYEHNHLITKLTILGSCVRTSNTGIFDATLPWCSALFFYDPFDSDPDNTLGLWEKRNSWLISDIVRLIQWANRFHYGAEMNPLLLKHFRRLGDIARTIALNTKSNKNEYEDQKGVCMARVLVEFGKPGISTSKGNGKSVFRHSLGTDSNGSKRVKM
ncbi:uncharacterized protein EAF01_009356 [Botrytis porri]|uniref:Uncharacterized protein n=1 Tax=Botrytis porri TaxID=87229 RepID=A0A4Z1K5C9_9HELO|nr:uncharacterized protein EAF01_009356 [Botrytis porri]KAF7896953.1 hypothetical protein EAF01_009356 [Botrytis porri]TGO80858.1 hypothetical protein BPOR_1612g00010 [Botrytis porri]